MGEAIKGFERVEVIRLWTGSPGNIFTFTGRMDSVQVDVLGSPGVYVNFTGAAATTGSTMGLVLHLL